MRNLSKMHKVCILAAGRGTRNTSVKGLHKALLPVSNKAAISKILDQFPAEIPVIIATGYKHEQVEEYCKLVHSEREIEFIRVENFDGPGSGPGLSLLACKDSLQCPFIFTSVDTLLIEDLDFFSLDENWVAVSLVAQNESEKYSLVDINSESFDFYFKDNVDAYAFTGIAGVRDYNSFWESLTKSNPLKGEFQVLGGLAGLNLVRKKVTQNWIDTGNNQSYESAKIYFPNDIVIEKNDESIFIDNGWVIKYFLDDEKSSNRVKRSLFLGDSTPEVVSLNKNMFAYRFIQGKRLSDLSDESLFDKFLDDYFERFFHSDRSEDIKEDCYEMYVNKTAKRIKKFSGTPIDLISRVNGVLVDPVETILNRLSWEEIIKSSICSKFHGDLQPENIIYSEDLGRFFYIDWRESFGKNLEAGDLYYDLGKLYHALVISNSVVMNGGYSLEIDFEKSYANLSFLRKSNLASLDLHLERFCNRNNLSYSHVKLLGILNYLNIASLYDGFQEGRYGKFLYLLGKKMLTQWIEENIK